tara:strand:+ start:6039 stop:6431 length:393 start_codon:yes stop_codon:yes gene_type:complete
MQIEIIGNLAPIGRSYAIFNDLDPKKIMEEGRVRVIPEYVTKTRIHTGLFDGQAMKGINFEVDGIKTHAAREWNALHNETYESNYFVKSKKQDYEVYKKYVEEVTRKAMSIIGVEIEKLEVLVEAFPIWG